MLTDCEPVRMEAAVQWLAPFLGQDPCDLTFPHERAMYVERLSDGAGMEVKCPLYGRQSGWQPRAISPDFFKRLRCKNTEL